MINSPFSHRKGDAGALRGGERPHEGVTEDLPWILRLRPKGSAQDDTRGFHGRDDRARLKAGGFLPHPFYRVF